MKSAYLSSESLEQNTIHTIDHPKFQAKISAFGGHLLSFVPNGKADLLWMSDSAVLNGTKAIRGGVPLCWPWFGPAEIKDEPQHGYARIVFWQITDIDESDEKVVIEMTPNFTQSLPVELAVKVRFTFTDSAQIDVFTTNLAATNTPVSQAIHTYFNVKDISSVVVPELDQVNYLDKLDNGKEKLQTSKLQVKAAMDTVYLTDKEIFTIETNEDNINITGNGHDSVVVWNPWSQGAQAMGDFDDQGYLSMLCIEMANTQGLQLEPKQTHVLTQTFSY